VPVIEQTAQLPASPATVFAYLTDPDRRGEWDDGCSACTLLGDRPAKGARLQLQGRRMAPSWVGEYRSFDPPRRATLTLIDGQGMPFASFSESFTLASRSGGSTLTLRLEYETRGMLRLIEPVTVRSRLRRTTARSLAGIVAHFG
jgi:uncharacterized protein YndB with AHSA1/START domain